MHETKDSGQNTRHTLNVCSAQCQGHRRRQHRTDKYTPSSRIKMKIPDPAGNRTLDHRVGRQGFYRLRQAKLFSFSLSNIFHGLSQGKIFHSSTVFPGVLLNGHKLRTNFKKGQNTPRHRTSQDRALTATKSIALLLPPPPPPI